MYPCTQTYRTLEELLWALKQTKYSPLQLPSLLNILPCPHLLHLLCAQHPFSMLFKYSKKHNLFKHFYVYLPNIFPYLHASTSFTATCHCLYFLKLLGLTHSSALVHIFSRPDSKVLPRVSHLPTVLPTEKEQADLGSCLRSQHLLQVTFWSSPFCRGLQVTLKPGLQHFMLFRQTAQAAPLQRTVSSASCLYYSYMVDSRGLFKRGRIQILNSHFDQINSKLHLSPGNPDM